MKGELDELKRKYDEHLILVEKKAEINQLQGEMLWSIVQDNEADYERQMASVEAIEKELRSVEDEANGSTAKCESILERINALQRQIFEIKEALEVEKG